MKQNLWRSLCLVNLIFMLIIFATSEFLGGCNSQLELASGSTTYMKCHWTFVANGFIAIIGCAIALMGAFAKVKESRLMMAVSVIVVYVILAIMPNGIGIGICASADMACHMTGYVTWILCALGAIVSVTLAVKSDPADADKPKMKL